MTSGRDGKVDMTRRGRPAGFDRAEALQSAMQLFWARGFEGVTLEDLQRAMGGITPPSFYHAFGSKEALFKEVADLYVAEECVPPLHALQKAKTAREGIEAMLKCALDSFTQPGKPQGCLLLNGATECTPHNEGPHAYIKAARQSAPECIVRRLSQAVAEGEVPPGADLRAIASFYATLAHGLAIRAADGAPRAELMAAVDGAMAAWTTITKSSPGPVATAPPQIITFSAGE
jgi:AcrR family transcriptional regulator